MSAGAAVAARWAPAGGTLPELWVPEAQQWLSTTSGRVASDGYSWMQSVHWVVGSGVYVPRRYRSHGPRAMCRTTLYIAQLLAELSPCRPGIEYLMRRTGLSERAVKYHLAMLREAGLLVYVSRGTRVSGVGGQASEFALIIPAAFDAALGIRTTGEDAARRVTGIVEAGRELMARLAKRAARKVRAARKKTGKPGGKSAGEAAGKGPAKAAAQACAPIGPKASTGGAGKAGATAVSAVTRCTPMGGSAVDSSTAGATSYPSESKLASGERKCPTPKKSKGKASGRRKLNVVGRRFQLARELTEHIDWLRGCSVPRIAWVARGVADAGWTVAEVQAWLHYRGEAARVRRGSGLLAVLLRNATTLLDTPAKRAAAVEDWRAAQEAARRERIGQVRARRERFEGDWQPPASQAVRRQVEEAFAAAFGPKPPADEPGEELPQLSGLEDLSKEEIGQARIEAREKLMVGDTSLITLAVEAMGRQGAERLYGAALVRRGLQLASAARSSLMTLGRR